MNKAVLISIRPEWCIKIISGEKTVEVRKKAPKIQPPYKVYVYCTNGRTLYRSNYDGVVRICHNRRDHALQHHTVFNGTVFAEFICDADLPLLFECSDPAALVTHYMVPGTCLSDMEIMNYLGNGKEGHGLHISGLVVYEKPLLLSDFQTRRDCGAWITWKRLSRPPQNFCYVGGCDGDA